MTPDPLSEHFNDTARLFPLPNLVLFPGVVQGLHIFEPRYRQMTADALATDSLIALVLLQPDWEEEYDHKPAIEPVACVGRIVWSEKLPDGRYNLRLRGLNRIRILEEVPTDRLYRTARFERLIETAPTNLDELKALRRELASVILPRFEGDGPARRQIQELFDGELSLGQLCDVLGYALPMPLNVKQALLVESHADRRAAALMDAFRDPPAPTIRPFPPGFSPN
ncbi:MAG: peptidase S16 [Planctomycetaceae bacterium]|nr:peptidase S16 [Planctomycetaceae bacterium]